MRIVKSNKTVKASTDADNYNDYVEFVYLNTKLSKDEAFKVCRSFWNKDVNKQEAIKWINDGYTDIDACDDVKASKKLSANDQALTHIKAAIDILGKSGNKDDITKDSIANLGVVMFDLQSKK